MDLILIAQFNARFDACLTGSPPLQTKARKSARTAASADPRL
jgi:hypothetical protein